MYLLDVSIRYLNFFCVLFVLFVDAVSFIAMLHLHLRWFYYKEGTCIFPALDSPNYMIRELDGNGV